MSFWNISRFRLCTWREEQLHSDCTVRGLCLHQLCTSLIVCPRGLPYDVKQHHSFHVARRPIMDVPVQPYAVQMIDVEKYFGLVCALRHINFEVGRNEI